MSKRLLILGGSRYIVPVIEAAHELGAQAITCDYLPDNYAHAFSDGYVNASVVDRDAVLRAAESVQADGIMSFACDPGVVPAAWVAEQLGLPFQGSFEAVSILQNKERFRSFLRENGFACPEMWVFSSAVEAANQADDIAYPVIVKPVDSAGSKGCSRVDAPYQLKAAVDEALRFSLSGRCIVEQFLEKAYDSSDADGFIVDGRFACISFTAQLFDGAALNPYAPAAYIMPARIPAIQQDSLRSELQRLASLLGLRDGIFNIETRVARDGKAYIMECTPRGGGNRLAEMLRFATNGATDLVRGSVQAALGLPVDCADEAKLDGCWYQHMVHADRSGTFGGIEYAPEFAERHLVEEQLWVEPGTRVEGFASASNAFGSLMLQFADSQELEEFRRAVPALVRVRVS